MYGIEEDGRLAAAGSLYRLRGDPPDAGPLTHPAARGAAAREIVVPTYGDALGAAEHDLVFAPWRRTEDRWRSPDPGASLVMGRI